MGNDEEDIRAVDAMFRRLQLCNGRLGRSRRRLFAVYWAGKWHTRSDMKKRTEKFGAKDLTY